MSSQQTSHADRYARIRSNPNFQQLVASRSRLTWALSACVLGGFYLFMALVAFLPGSLHAPLAEGSKLTVGIPVAALVIVGSWLLTGWYVYKANSRFDALTAALLKEVQ